MRFHRELQSIDILSLNGMSVVMLEFWSLGRPFYCTCLEYFCATFLWSLRTLRAYLTVLLQGAHFWYKDVDGLWWLGKTQREYD